MDFRRVHFQDRDLTEDTLIAGGDLTWDLDIATFKTGVKLTQTDRENDYTRTRYDGGTLDLTLGTDTSFTDGALINDTAAGDAPNIWMDVDAMNRSFMDPANADYFELNDGDTFASNFAGDYDITESVYAAYAVAEREFGNLSLIGGVRVEMTDVDATGFLRQDGVATSLSQGGDYT